MRVSRPKVSNKKRSSVIGSSAGDLVSQQSLNVLLIQTHDNLFSTAIESEIEALKCKFLPQLEIHCKWEKADAHKRMRRAAGCRNTGLEKSNNNLGNRGVVCLHCFGIPVRHFSFFSLTWLHRSLLQPTAIFIVMSVFIAPGLIQVITQNLLPKSALCSEWHK